jgi:putative ABC transport system permease protein
LLEVTRHSSSHHSSLRIVLKGTFRKAHAAINPRKILVVAQFTFAIVLIISTVIIVQQLEHAREREVGYERGHLVYHWMTGELYDKYPLIKNELIREGIATSVTKTNAPMTESFSDTWSLEWEGKSVTDRTDIHVFAQDESISKTVGLRVVKGRDFDLKLYPTDSNAMLINESAAKAMGIDEPKGQIVKNGTMLFHVVGIFKDVVFGSPYEQTQPMVIQGASANWFNIIYLKLNSARSTADNLSRMEKIFTKYNPAFPFEYHFTDDDYARKFDATKRTATMTGLFAGLTILISCLGLFGLAAYMAENRIKEIGIRKVLGASVLKITTLLSKDFIKLVMISILIASPVAWYAMNVWLEDYTYRINIQWWVFAGSGLVSVLISLLTISYQAVKAALGNPVKSLRNE